MRTERRARGILFSDEMVRAILDGRKTQTRRVVKGVGNDNCLPLGKALRTHVIDAPGHGLCPYGRPGDLLYVREAWQAIHVTTDVETGIGEDFYVAPEIPAHNDDGWWGVAYAATDQAAHEHPDDRGFRWRPSIHMPRWAARIWLEIVDVRVERVQAITGSDAMAEGVPVPAHMPQDGADLDWARRGFRELWDALNAPRGFPFADDPWVWRIEFRRTDAP